jgi:hypothetical protein
MEQTLEDSVGFASLGASAPSPLAEKSHGIDPDYRLGVVLVRRWWILGPPSWSLVRETERRNQLRRFLIG